jgi:hypothetical protein
LELSFGALAAAACTFLSVVIWRSVAAFQPMWPLPGLYLVEVVAVTAIAASMLALGRRQRAAFTWAAAGVVTAFSILGALSIGAAYAPTALLLAAAGVSADWRDAQPVSVYIGIFLAAGAAQAILMLSLIGLF